ncbi:MAG: hypothetical protein E7526_06135 [Ruminococcaceae bacterium]|nr:hypothetical protein [Oscillospiraceae bacterium]
MKKSKLILGVTGAVLLVFLIYQLYAVFYNPVTTEIVTAADAVDGIKITGIIIRNEEIIKSDTSAAMHFEINDNERVAAGGVIANLYGSSTQSVAAAELKNIEKEINNIEQIHKYNDLNAVDIGTLNAKIYDEFNIIASITATGKFSSLQSNKEEMLALMNRRKLATGQEVDFSAQLSALKTKRDALLSRVGQPIGVLKTEKSGYFVSATDGYENILTPDKLDSITPEFLDDMKPENAGDDKTVGKLVSDYTMYIAASVSINDSLSFKVGDKLVINTSLKSNPELDVEVHDINVSHASDRAVIIFSCQEMSGELSSMRTDTMTVVKKKYSGLKVGSKALRVSTQTVTNADGTQSEKTVTGVYIVNGVTAEFVPVNIIYTYDNYALCEIISEDGNLRLYDEVIVKGKNIYEGKIID